ncbi:CCAAT/enhancer-binding protein beta-like [Haliotis rufescens]|uniref:CCAAT/enhancer-binding protein beta-like n=1 Tax=Haliotis rufescens TaxID=6454 RepID=UPI001EB07FD9|nr:CCAAT/enhancer-binding protein beta-like [Haliotis rufescens]
MDTLQMYDTPLIEASKDSALASQQHAQVVKTELTSPVQTDFVALGPASSTAYPTTVCMPEFEQLASGSEDSQSVWDQAIKAEDAAYSACSETTTFTSLTNLASPTVSSSSQIGSPGPVRSPSGKGSSRKRQLPKGTEEYIEKRARNNIAVRKSRAKAKEKQKQTEGRVSNLVGENERLQKKVDLLTKELNVLKGLFINVGAALPSSFAKLLES